MNSYCKTVAYGDIVWQMYGASLPSVIRFRGSYFEIIVVAVPTLPMLLSQLANDPAACSAITKNRRQVTMIWNWEAAADGTSASHEALHELDTAAPSDHPSSEMRISNSLRVLDDLQERSIIDMVLNQIARPIHEPELLRHVELLKAACDMWSSYM